MNMRAIFSAFLLLRLLALQITLAGDVACLYQFDRADGSSTSMFEENADVLYCTLRNSALCLMDSGNVVVRVSEADIASNHGLHHSLIDLQNALCSSLNCDDSHYRIEDHLSISTYVDTILLGPTAITIPNIARRRLQSHAAHAPFGVNEEFVFAMSVFGAWKARKYDSKLSYKWSQNYLEPTSVPCSGFCNAFVFGNEENVSTASTLLMRNLFSSCAVDISWNPEISTAIKSLTVGGRLCFEDVSIIGPLLRPFQGTYDAMRYFEESNKLAARDVEIVLFLSSNMDERNNVPRCVLVNYNSAVQYLAPRAFGRQIFHLDIRSLPIEEQDAVLGVSAMTIVLGNLDEALTPRLTSTSLRPGSSIIEIVPPCRTKSTIFEDAALTSGLFYFRYILSKDELNCVYTPSLNASNPSDQMDVCNAVFVSDEVKRCCMCSESSLSSMSSKNARNQSFYSNKLVTMDVRLDLERFYPFFEAATDIFGWRT
jgi:hypothetical protein